MALLGAKEKIEPEKDIKTRFSDVKGIDEFKDELEDILAKAKEARQVSIPDPEPQDDGDDEPDDRAPSDDEIDRDAQDFARG